MPRGRPVAGSARGRSDRMRAAPGLDARRDRQRAGSDLVETGTAIDRPIVPRREWHDGLAPAGPADRGVELAWALVRSSPLGGGPARWASLRVVRQPLAGVEGLFARREREFLGTIATGQTSVLVHPLRTLLGSGRHNRGPRPRGSRDRRGGARDGGARPGRPGPGDPELLAVKIRAPSSPLLAFARPMEPCRGGERRAAMPNLYSLHPCLGPRRHRRRLQLRRRERRHRPPPQPPRPAPRRAPPARPPAPSARSTTRPAHRRPAALRGRRRIRHAGLHGHPGPHLHPLRRRHRHLPQPDGRSAPRRSAPSSRPFPSAPPS